MPVHINQHEDQAGPFPTPGIAATWVASKRFYFDGRVQYLDLHIDQLDGSLGFLEFDALYRFRPNVSFALGYTNVKAHLSSTQTIEFGPVRFQHQGSGAFRESGVLGDYGAGAGSAANSTRLLAAAAAIPFSGRERLIARWIGHGRAR